MCFNYTENVPQLHYSYVYLISVKYYENFENSLLPPYFLFLKKKKKKMKISLVEFLREKVGFGIVKRKLFYKSDRSFNYFCLLYLTSCFAFPKNIFFHRNVVYFNDVI